MLFVFAATAFVRYMLLAGFTNDQFEHLAGAQQMLFGEWPTRDFIDPGMPLTYAMSALAQLLLGRTLFAEAVLNACAFGLAAICTLVGAHRLSRSLVIATIAAVFTVAIFPRGYAYPKLVVTAAGPLVIWAWMARPTVRRMVGLAFAVVVAFLFRHDYGLYLGVAAMTGIAATPAVDRRTRIVRLATFCAIVAAVLLPYALYLEASGGLLAAVRSVIEYGQRHAERTQLHLAQLPWDSHTALLYAFHALPLIAIAAVSLDRATSADERRLVAPVIALAIVVNIGFLRDPLESRLADAVVPAVLIAAWLAGRAWWIKRPAARAISIAAVVVMAMLGARAVVAVGRLQVEWDHSELGRGWRFVPQRIRGQTRELLTWDVPRQSPDPTVTVLLPFFAYLDRCTTPSQRLLVTSYAPEIYVYAHRAFAGGQKVFMPGYYDSAADQAQIVARLKQQAVPFVLMTTDDLSWWEPEFSLVDTFVRSQYRQLVDIRVRGDRTIRVLENSSIAPTRIDAATGWPCYR